MVVLQVVRIIEDRAQGIGKMGDGVNFDRDTLFIVHGLVYIFTGEAKGEGGQFLFGIHKGVIWGGEWWEASRWEGFVEVGG